MRLENTPCRVQYLTLHGKQCKYQIFSPQNCLVNSRAVLTVLQNLYLHYTSLTLLVHIAHQLTQCTLQVQLSCNCLVNSSTVLKSSCVFKSGCYCTVTCNNINKSNLITQHVSHTSRVMFQLSPCSGTWIINPWLPCSYYTADCKSPATSKLNSGKPQLVYHI